MTLFAAARLWAFLAVAAFGSNTAVGQPAASNSSPSLSVLLDGLTQLDYSSTSPFALGDGLSSLNLSQPRERCIQYEPTDLAEDTAGAVTTRLRAFLVRDHRDLSTEFNYNYSVQATASATVAKILSGESSLTNTGRFEAFFRSQRQSLMLVVEASADHGRRMIGGYQLQPTIQSLVNERNFAEFERRCGTHFLRGVQRRSTLRIVFHLSDLDQTMRSTIASTWMSSNKGSLTVEAATATARTELSSSISLALTLASRSGRVSTQVEASGGSGIATVGKLIEGLQVTSVNDIQRLVSGVVDAAKDFTAANAAPGQFIVVAYPQLPSLPAFDNVRFDALGVIYSKLLRVDEQLEEYRTYRTEAPTLWERYFRPYQERMEALRNDLVLAYRMCLSGGTCTSSTPDVVDGVFLSNVITSGVLRADCLRTSTVEEAINIASPTVIQVLSSLTLLLRADLRFYDHLDVLGTEVFRLTPDFTRESIPFRPNEFMRVSDATGEMRRLFATVYSRALDPREVTTDGRVDYAKLSAIRDDVARSLYVIRFALSNGRRIEQVLGFPDMRGCTLVSGG
jgi:hypothetical protein